jgi:hypothetical protein
VSSPRIPPELQIVLPAASDEHSPPWQHARFLRSAFEETIWDCRFEGCASIQINFHVRLGSGYLTDKKHANLLSILKGWICCQDHPSSSRSGNVSPIVMRRRVEMVLHLIDYLLLNATVLGLEDHGLNAVVRSDIHVMFHRLASSNDLSEAVYEWSSRLTVFLRAAGSSLTKTEVARAVSKCPEIRCAVPDENECTLSLEKDQLIRARAYLVLNDLMSDRGSLGRSPNSTRLSESLYRNTLSGIGPKPTPPELVIGADLQFYRELPQSPCRDFESKRRNDKSLGLYNKALDTLSLLPKSVLKADPAAIRAWEPGVLKDTFQTSSIGRTRSLPVPVVLRALRQAIEFTIDYGRDIVDAFVSLATEAHDAEKNCCSSAWSRSISSHLSKCLKEINVDRWIIENCEKRETAAAHFARLRSAPTLHELLHILIGASSIIVGTLMARRQGELTDLNAATCLDEAKRYLIFFNRKSGVFGLRERERRPIPSIAVQCILLLKDMQESLERLGFLGRNAGLFQAPADTGRIDGRGHSDLYRSMDLFCDFFEMDVDSEGRRYYIRQHQLRRFFAQVFFWHAGYGQMDTIRWFLGHIDIEHLYRYITEAVPGQVMHDIKADFAVERMSAGDAEAEALSRMVRVHFGVSSVGVLDHDELADYVTELLRTGTAKIEPIFFAIGSEKTFRIAIKVSP